MNFSTAFDYVILKEGGYSDDPLDRGGKTKFGISQAAYPSLNVADITLAQAKNIYHKDYWEAIKADRLPAPVAFMLFDMAVNQGAGAAALTLQEASGVLMDAKIGPLTIEAANEGYKKDAAGFLLSIAIIRARRYLSINNAAEERFEFGWIARLLATYSIAMSEVYRK